MACPDLKENEQYFKIPNYVMKCRLYPNKTQADMIDRIIHGVQVAYNNTLYDMNENHAYCIESVADDGKVYHNIDFKALGRVEHIAKLRAAHPDTALLPFYTLGGFQGLFASDLKAAASHKVISIEVDEKTGKKKVKHDKTPRVGKNGKLLPYSLEVCQPDYYTKTNKRKSYSSQVLLSTIKVRENKNRFDICLQSVGRVCVRGWNQRLRFDGKYQTDFLEYVIANPKKCINIVVKKEVNDEYYIYFKLSDVFKPQKILDNKECGIDVGLKDIMILSDGNKLENKRFKKNSQAHENYLRRKLNRQWGYHNPAFQKAKDAGQEPTPSKGYLKTDLKLSTLQHAVAEARKDYNNRKTTEIISTHDFIGVESLNVSGMIRNKHLSYALSDAAMGSILQMLDYKSKWYGRTIQPISKWTPSTKRCSNCGYVLPEIGLNVREWECPECHTHHDRDINAAQNILHYAKEIHNSAKT